MSRVEGLFRYWSHMVVSSLAYDHQKVSYDLASKGLACKIIRMKTENGFGLTRREFLAGSLIASGIFLDRTTCGLDAVAAMVELEPTPACRDTDDITPAQTPGPFYKPRS